MHYLLTHLDEAWALTVIHLRLSLVPVLIGLAIAVPLGVLVQRAPIPRRLTTATASIVFTIPSLALFVVLPMIIGTRILDEANVIVALTAYTAALLVRAVLEALDAVPAQVSRRRHRGRLPGDQTYAESRTAAVDPGIGRRAARGRRDEHRDGLGGFGDRHRRPGHLVHRGVSDRQERSDRRRHLRAVRAGDRHRRADRGGRPAGHPVGRAVRTTRRRSVVAPVVGGAR